MYLERRKEWKATEWNKETLLVLLSVCFLGETEDNMEVLEISIPKTQTMEATSPERLFGSHAHTTLSRQGGVGSRRERDL